MKKFCLILIILLLNISTIYSQEKRTEISIDFRVNSTTVDSAYMNNAIRMKELLGFLKELRKDSTINIVEVSFNGAASPEGSYQLNRRLARKRLSALEKIVRTEINIPDSIISRSDSYINWDYLKIEIEKSNLEYRDTVIAILEEEARLVDYYQPNTHVDNRIVKIRQLDRGKVWKQISKHFLKMRNACVILVTYQREEPVIPVLIPDTIVEDTSTLLPDTTDIVDSCIVEMDSWCRKLRLQTNILGLGLGITNAGVEFDFAKHWSFCLPIYYSGWNYFSQTTKFRTLAIQPELRYWLSENNNGFFAGAHVGVAYFNLAWGKLFRYQDHDMNTPALGGGLSIGYRQPLGKNKRWSLDVSVGAGVYSIHYDRFINIHNGMLVDSKQMVYAGLDHAAVSFTYMFDFAKRKK